jgi:hypothetical protein
LLFLAQLAEIFLEKLTKRRWPARKEEVVMLKKILSVMGLLGADVPRGLKRRFFSVDEF